MSAPEKKLVLIVDDTPTNVAVVSGVLKDSFRTKVATNGEKALAIAGAAEKPDLILLDVMMPGMDGFEVCRRLKLDPATAHIPVVMVTALDQVADRIRGLEAGADDFLTKPVNDLQLMTRVKSLVRLKTLTDELRLRASTTRNIGIEEMLARREPEAVLPKVLLVDERPASVEHLRNMLGPHSRSMRSPTRTRASSTRPRATTIASWSARASRISIRCACARSSARSTAPASCRSCWWPAKARTIASCAAWNSASTTTSSVRSNSRS
jgi:PleD family two-component response regulator